MRLEDKLWKTFNKALGQYQLIDEGDRILVGLSGGKDSLCLLELLARRSRIVKPRFSVEALHVRMENIDYESDTTYLRQFCEGLGVALHIVTTRFTPLAPQLSAAPQPSASPAADMPPSPSPTQPSTKPKPPCFLCSWQRRKQLFNVAQELGCTKIALGHHQDDLIHTALMNLTFQGHFTTMEPKLPMRKMPLAIIRPLCLCQEDDIRQFAEQRHYQKLIKLCPYEKDTNRTHIQRLFQLMQELNPEARYTITRALRERFARE